MDDSTRKTLVTADDDTDIDVFLAPLESSHTPDTFAAVVFRGWSVKLSGFIWLLITLVCGWALGPYAAVTLAFLGGITIYIVCYQAWKSERLRSDGFKKDIGKLRHEGERLIREKDAANHRAIEALAGTDHVPLIQGSVKDFEFVPLLRIKTPETPSPYPSIPTYDLIGNHACLIVGMTNKGSAITLTSAILGIQIDAGDWTWGGYPIKWDANQLGGKPNDIFRSVDVGKDLYACLKDNKEKLKKNEYLEGYFVFLFSGFYPERQSTEKESFETRIRLLLVDAAGNHHLIDSFSTIPREQITF